MSAPASTFDLTPTHVLNQSWPAHARLHEVWLLSTGALIGCFAVYLIWFFGNSRRSESPLACALMSCMLCGFFIAAGTASLYGGLLIDPATAHLMPNQDRAFGMPLNSFLFGVSWILLLAGTTLTLAP